MKRKEEMKTILLSKDGRCKWLENRILKKLLPEMQRARQENNTRPMYIIEDWISNDDGRVGVDLKWLNSLGISVAKTYMDVKENNCIVVNTGYDSIVDQEQILRKRGVEILDEPCPYVRKLRTIFENIDIKYQYVLLCEKNHIVVKNFKSIFPKDMILVQMGNYKQEIISKQNGKPLYLIPYVTFLPKHVNQIYEFIEQKFGERDNKVEKTSCMWIASPASPIVEINNMTCEQLNGVKEALLIATPGSVNKSLISLIETLEDKGLTVVKISSLSQYIKYSLTHRNETVLVVKSPIPNEAEEPIMDCIKYGIPKACAKVWYKKIRGNKRG